MALELGHQVEARQGGAEVLAEAGTYAALNELGAGEQPQPDAQRAMVVAAGDEFAVDGAYSKPE
jgi:hypothetical protein